MTYETRTLKLPSNGMFGKYSEVTIRSMTGRDEKELYSGLSIDKLLKNCIVEPANIDISDLCEPDKYYILLQIRILTFGSDYTFKAKCEDCGVILNVNLSLDDLEVFEADENTEKFLEYTVEFESNGEIIKGDTLRFKIPNSRDIKELDNRLVKLHAQNDNGLKYILRTAILIDTINGEEKSLSEKQKYLEECSSKVLALIHKAYSKIQLGVDTNVVTRCPNCNSMIEVPLVMNTEFFRPTFRN